MQFNKIDMNLQQRIDIISGLTNYMSPDNEEWAAVVQKAFQHNPWFIPEFIQTSVRNITEHLLDKNALEKWAQYYHLDDNITPRNVGIVMAGNIPLVGFHDFLCVFISGHRQTIKLSSKDDILLKAIVEKLHSLYPETMTMVATSDMLKGCDAYIATGSNNSARYFEQYFAKYPHIIRKNKTSVACLTGKETESELEKLSDDIHLYFGLGCRNVTKLFVPEGYDFIPLLQAFNKYIFFKDHHKFNNNYDYQLSIMLMNNVYYMTNGSTLLVEAKAAFSPISVLHYEFYRGDQPFTPLENDEEVQCRFGKGFIPFGEAQQPGLFSYADGVDTMAFLLTL
jgi:hypothetical protein